jgi:hypothetical protein
MLNLAAAALATGTLLGQAQAETVWRYPPKGGAPYAVPHEHTKPVAFSSEKQKAHVIRANRAHHAGAKSALH